MADKLSADPEAADQLLETALAVRAEQAARTNISRAMSELERAGLVSRHYVGRITDHCHRGGDRYAVYTLAPEALATLRRHMLLI